MAVNLIKKHGLVPKSSFPESISSSATLQMNAQLKNILRSAACELRAIMNDTIDISNNEYNARKHKVNRMNDIWRMLCIHLGTPPRSFNWQWTDKDKVFHRKGKMSPIEFCKEYVEIDWENYVCVVHDPRNKSMQTYTVDYLQSVAGGEPVKYLNIDCESMKQLTLKNIQAGLPVWMGCDVGKQFHRVKGVWDENMFEYSNLYGCDYGMNKLNRLLHGQTLMTHAMMFTGVDVGDDGKPIRWRVENSWGDVNGIIILINIFLFLLIYY
jgi:bleomycin hydrolase